ncbi:MAG: AbrB/MazE/SpoVT family DNA-binding domain-containing protein [Chloroflexi bacterium]|nr:AbrB/MazE/SpoVT family DNA-binding domain-containing protein [Chloroflexota bacterium]
MAKSRKNEAYVDSQGRVVIPAHLRRAMNIGPGETLYARVRDGQLVLGKLDQVVARLKDTFSSVPSDVSLVDELISERRNEAIQESED